LGDKYLRFLIFELVLCGEPLRTDGERDGDEYDDLKIKKGKTI
jgi:hypothetical protein